MTRRFLGGKLENCEYLEKGRREKPSVELADFHGEVVRVKV